MRPCWLAEYGFIETPGGLVLARLHPTLGKCEGPIDRCHLLPRRVIRDELRCLAHSEAHLLRLELDPRTWVHGCRSHHHLLDVAKKLRVGRAVLPPDLDDYAAEFDPMLGRSVLAAWLDREYGEAEAAA